jgi:dynactin complex subunit
MNFKEAIKKLDKSEIFKKETGILSHAFIMPPNEEWQLGFYNKKTDKVITYFVKETIEKSPPAEVMKENPVNELNISKVNISLKEALEFAENETNSEINKKIVVLQNIDIGQVWNITFLTKDFKVVNFKIDSENKT